jgi:hypothetical protein
VLFCARLGDGTGGRLGPPLRLGAEGRSPIPCPAWRIDRPSAGPGSGVRPLAPASRQDDGFDARGLTPVHRFPRRTIEDKGVGMRRSLSSDTPRGMVARPAKRRAAVGGGRAGRPSRPMDQVMAIRARAWTPCPSSHPLGRPGRGEARCAGRRASRAQIRHAGPRRGRLSMMDGSAWLPLTPTLSPQAGRGRDTYSAATAWP